LPLARRVKQALIKLYQVAPNARRREFPFHQFAARLAKLAPKRGIGCQLIDRIGERIRVSERYQQLSMPNHHPSHHVMLTPLTL